jgi:flagellar basal body rod protein FlgG
MTRGTYTAASGMLANLTAQDTIAQNLANASTTGYKASVPRFESFNSMLLDRMSGAAMGGQSALGTGVSIQGTATDFTAGALNCTGNPLDVALTGDAFLVVKTPQGTFYSRDGALRRDLNGTLMQTGSSAVVLGTNKQPIVIPTTAQDIDISPSGQVSADGALVGRIAMVGLDSSSNAVNVGGSSFSASSPHAASPEDTIEQGFLESSNVSTVSAMIRMINAQRSYEANAKVLQSEDEVTAQAITKVAASS